MPRVRSAVLLLALLMVACGNDEGPPGSTGLPVSTAPRGTTGATTTSLPAPEQPLPGERVEIFPYMGARLAVVGVPAGDTLNVRAGPGVPFAVVVTLAPLATGVTATGHNRSLGEAGFWAEVTVDGKTGWANNAFLLQPGVVEDITATMFPTPGERPRATSMLELAQTVGRRRGSDEPRSKVVVVDGPTVGDLGEVTVDVIGLGDDSVGGERLKIFAEPAPGGQSFTVRTVEATALCSRGVSEGLCL